MWNDEEVQKFEELNHNSEVMGVRMRPECVIVLLHNRAYLYSMPGFEIIGQIDTVQDGGPHIGLSHSESNFLLALPSPEPRAITVKSSLDRTVQEENLVVNDRNPVSTLAVTADGELMAVSSINGKRIKIFDLKRKELIKIVRRGFRQKQVFQIFFSSNKQSLFVTTEDTAHLFLMNGDDNQQ